MNDFFAIKYNENKGGLTIIRKFRIQLVIDVGYLITIGIAFHITNKS